MAFSDSTCRRGGNLTSEVLDFANRAFAASVDGQRYKIITREEAERIRHPVYQPATVERKARRYSGAPCSLNQ